MVTFRLNNTQDHRRPSFKITQQGRFWLNPGIPRALMPHHTLASIPPYLKERFASM
ncbi:hypothetical protein [Thermosporothrix hazakensis]|uniref:hypothetical protein n=1 Tax=Thermosporothrix hazakensis TaxID=644383 RepID=UPI001B87E0EB|nr:hypothetical protein [Thermosporothrix hazakensis]